MYKVEFRQSIGDIIIYVTKKRMFPLGGSYNEQPGSGKKIHGLPTRKQPSFTLGWDQTNQLNSYQIRKGKDQQITGKITGAKLQSRQSNDYYDEALERQKTRQLYEKLSYENPDIPPEELERYMMGYEQKRRQSRQSNSSHKPQQGQQQQYERRAPIRQKDSMRDIIFNGVGVSQTSEQQRAASRRNNSNMVLRDGYNYHQNNNR